jgi:hypothetical protein
MTKASVVTLPTTELKLPKIDLDALFTAQKTSLGVVHEAQTILIGAVQAIAKVQYDYVEQALTDAKAAFGRKELPKPELMLADIKVSADKAVAVTKEVVDLAVAAQRRVGELFTARTQASVDELKALAA